MDLWKHRTKEMTCITCMWYVGKEAIVDAEDDPTTATIGRCRRHAPTMTGYPVVFPADWCGDHKLHENRV